MANLFIIANSALIPGFKYLGLASLILFLAAIHIVLSKVPTMSSRTASQHAANSKKVWVLYELVLSMALILFYFFCTKWFIPHFRLPNIFTILLTAIVSMQLIGNWLPDKSDGSLITRLHRLLYYVSGSLLPVLIWLIASSENFSVFSRILAGAAIGISVVFLILVLFVRKSHEKYLWFQLSYFLLFLAVIFNASYLI